LADYRLVYVESAVVYHRNHDTLAGLWGEGFCHGHHSVRTLKRHRLLLQGRGFRRFHGRSWPRIVHTSVALWREGQPVEALCHLVFNMGKKAGKLVGSVRYGYPTW